MTISTQTRIVNYSGNGVTVNFAYPFKIMEAADLKVYKQVSGVWTLQTVTTDYTITGLGASEGGTVTFVIPPEIGVGNVRLLRRVQLTQLVNYILNDDFPAEVHEGALDKLTMALQDYYQESMTSDQAVEFWDALSRRISNVANPVYDQDAVTKAWVLSQVLTGTGEAVLHELASTAPGKGSALVTYSPEGVAAIPTSVQNKLRESISVKDFGAVGNGITDDTDAVQAAITAAYGGSLYVPEGVYLVTAVTAIDSIYIYGEGTLKQKPDSGTSQMLLLSGSSKNFSFYGLRFDGNQQGQTVKTGRTLSYGGIGTANEVSSLVVDNCTFVNGCSADIFVRNDSSRTTRELVQITRCRFLAGYEATGAETATYISISSPVSYLIADNVVDFLGTPAAKGRSGFVIQDGYSQASTDRPRGAIVANIFEGVGRGGTDPLGCIDLYTYGETITIAGNSINRCYGRGIAIKADARNIAIDGNTVEGLTDLLSVSADGAIVCNTSVTTTAGGIVNVSGNSIYNSSSDGVVFTGRDSSGTYFASTVNINGNTVSTCTKRGINVTDIDDITITANAITGATLQSVIIDKVRGVANVVGNTLTNCGSEALRIANSGGVKGMLNACGNVFAQNSWYGIQISGLTSGCISGNLIDCPTFGAFSIDGVSGNLRITSNYINSPTPLALGGSITGAVRIDGNTLPTAIGSTVRTLTIAAGVIKVFSDMHLVATEGGAATDDLDTINGGTDNVLVTLFAADAAKDVVVKHGTGNIRLHGAVDFTLNNGWDNITLRYYGGFWIEVSRADIGS